MAHAESRGTAVGRAVLVACAVVMVILAVAFWVRSSTGVASSLTRGYIGALCLAGALPYAWILLLAARRLPTLSIAGIVCALLYLVGFGWFAVLLVLLSWGDTTLWIPALGLPVQGVALVAAALARWGEWRAGRGAGSWGASLGTPLMLVALPLLLASALKGQIAELPRRHQEQASNAETLLRSAQRCLIEAGTRATTGFPERLDDAGAALSACAEPWAGLVASRTTTRWSYWIGPADERGRRRTFVLCGQPVQVPDAGSLTIVGDQNGARGMQLAADGAREPASCADAWGGGVPQAVKRLQTCLLIHAVQRGGGFPDSLGGLAAASPCRQSIAQPAAADGAGEWGLRVGVADVVGLRYLAGPADPSGRHTDYELALQCPGQTDRVIVNAEGEIRAPGTKLAAELLNGCHDPGVLAADDLATRFGFVLRSDSSPEVAAATEPAGVAVTVAEESEPQYGDTPDLAARRAECAKSSTACYGLGREIERSLTLAGANPYRVETLDPAQRALRDEADRAFIRACAAGSRLGCYAEADMWLSDRERGDDPVRAALVLRENCKAGHVPSCIRLGELLESGRQPTRHVASSIQVAPGGAAKPLTLTVPDKSRPGVQQDSEGAISAFAAACRMGDSDSCLRRNRLLLDWPEASGAQRTEALHALARSCDLGQAAACYLLTRQPAAAGRVEGRDVAVWRDRACRLGELAACDSLAR